MNDIMREKLFNILSDKNNNLKPIIVTQLKKNNPKFQYIKDMMNILFPNYEDISEIFYMLKHNLISRPLCPICHSEIKFEHSTSTYPKHCCCRCTQLDKDVRNKIENTMINKYGVSNSMYSDKFKDKIKKTSLIKYGAENVFCTNECKDKIKKTNITKYGCNNPHQNKLIIKKYYNTMLQKYGVKHPTQNHEIRLKTQQKYFYDNRYFDSMIEIAYYIYLQDHNIKFEYEPNCDFDYDYNGIKHKYFPDFHLVESNQYVEIKGNHFFKKDGTMCNPYDHTMDDLYEAKHQCMIKNNVKILIDNDMKDIKSYIIKKFGSYDYLLKFKNTNNILERKN